MLHTGVDLLTLARVRQDDLAGYAAAAPVVLPVNSIDLPEEGSGKAIYKDGHVIGFHNTGKEQSITINCAAISPAVLSGLLYDENPVFIDTGLNRINYFALGFRLLQDDGSYDYYSYLKGTIKVDAKSIETRQGTAATIERITFMPAVTSHRFEANSQPCRKISFNSKDKPVDVAGWLSMVWTPDVFLPVLPPPVIEISSGYDVGTVTILTDERGAIIRYTTDGSEVNGASPIYSGPFEMTRNGIIKARVEKAGYITSDVTELSIATLKVKTPVVEGFTESVESVSIVFDFNY